MQSTSLRPVMLLGLALVVAPLSCGSSDSGAAGSAGNVAGSNSGPAGAGAGAAAGSAGTAASSGSSGTAGAGVGGSTHAGSAGTSSTAGAGPVCKPSTGVVSGNPLCANYLGSDDGVPPDANLYVASYTPNQPLAAGQPYAVSALISGNSPMVEVWGSNSKCGPGLQKLAEKQTVAEHSYCFELQPNAEYTELLLVFRGSQVSGSSFSNLLFCGGGSCQ